MISVMMNRYSLADKEIMSYVFQSAIEAFEFYCKIYECSKCPARRVCKDVKIASRFVDEELAKDRYNI